MTYVRVVPVLRTPAGIDAFDYAVPDGTDYRAGDLVWTPFRKRKTPALVIETSETSPFAKRAQTVIGPYANLRLPKSSVGLLRWLSEWTCSSQPTILSSWLRNLPKRPKDAEITFRTRDGGSMEAVWLADPEHALVSDAIGGKGRVLIVTPWITSAKRLAGRIKGSEALLAEAADGLFFDRWTAWAGSEAGTLVTTRVGSWLAPMADTVLLHLPEQDDHKQDELAPRYDARRIAAWCAQHANTRVRAYGVTPPIGAEEPAPDLDLPFRVAIRHPKGRSAIPHLQADVLNTILDHEGSRIIIHPIRGVAARFTCRDCGWQAVCERCAFPVSHDIDHAVCRRCGWSGSPPISCASCGGVDLGKSIPGIERLKAAWKKEEADIEVEWRTLAVEESERPIPHGALVTVTDASFLAGAVEDVRRDERLVVAVRHLAARVRAVRGTLLLQANENEAALLETCVTSDGFAAYRVRERALRSEFGYPPETRLVKLLVDGSAEHADGVRRRILRTLSGFAGLQDVRGPFPVAYRPRGRRTRFVIHVVFAKHVPSGRLSTVFRPLAQDGIIDLDPIAFFR